MIEGIDEKAIIAKYINAPMLYLLKNGEQVVGQEVDLNNRLIYVIKNNVGEFRISYAQDEDPIQTLPNPDTQTSTIVSFSLPKQ